MKSTHTDEQGNATATHEDTGNAAARDTAKDAALNVIVAINGEPCTVRVYLQELLLAVWDEGESFSGKRPFGNSGWEYELYAGLIRDGFVKGALDEDGCVEDLGDDAPAFVHALIEYVFAASVAL